MSLMTAVRTDADIVELVRERMAGGAPIRELAFMDMPVWLFADLDLGKPVRAIFQSDAAALVVYSDGTRLLRQAPAGL